MEPEEMLLVAVTAKKSFEKFDKNAFKLWLKKIEGNDKRGDLWNGFMFDLMNDTKWLDGKDFEIRPWKGGYSVILLG